MFNGFVFQSPVPRVDERRRHHPPIFQLHNTAAQTPKEAVLLLLLLAWTSQDALHRVLEIRSEPRKQIHDGRANKTGYQVPHGLHSSHQTSRFTAFSTIGKIGRGFRARRFRCFHKIMSKLLFQKHTFKNGKKIMATRSRTPELGSGVTSKATRNPMSTPSAVGYSCRPRCNFEDQWFPNPHRKCRPRSTPFGSIGLYPLPDIASLVVSTVVAFTCGECTHRR